MYMTWRIFIAILILVVVVLIFTNVRHTTVAVEPAVATSTVPVVAPIIAIAAVTGEFSEAGTLVFYPNNVGPVPYLFYLNQRGDTVAKALIFDNLPPTDFSSWTGSHVYVTGVLDREHVIVDRILYLGPP
jgi:hypothetical protein